DLIQNPPNRQRKVVSFTPTSEGIKKIPEGQRNQTLASFAGVLRRQGLNEEAMLPVMIAYNETLCDPPLDSKEVKQIVRSICRYPAGTAGTPQQDTYMINKFESDFDPMPLPEKKPAAPFPTQLFPPRIRKFIEEGAKGLHVQPDFLGGFVLATSGLAIGNTRLIETKRGWRQKPNLWVCLVAPPGSAKTPALDLAFRPVIERQKQADLIYQQKLEEYKQDLFEYELEKKL